MSKSRKKKSGKKTISGQTLGALALIISLVALGLGVYQLILSDSGPTVYVARYDTLYDLDLILLSGYLVEPELTYTTKPGDSVLLEFSCEILVDGTTVYVRFSNNGTHPNSQIRIDAGSGEVYKNDYFRHFIESSEGGEYRLRIIITILDMGTNSWIRYCLLTATVY